MLIRSLFLVGVLALPAAAYPDQLAPEGWASERNGAMTEYTSPSGRERVVIRQITSETDPLKTARAIASGSDVDPDTCQRQSGVAMAACAGSLRLSGGELLIRVYVAETGQNLTGLIHMGLSTEAGLTGRMNTSGARLKALASDTAAPTQSPPAPAPLPPNTTAGPSADLERVVFDLSYSYGVGGAVYPKYAPLYLFKDGGACRCADLAPGDVELAQLRRTRPEDVGTWTRAGADYAVTYADGERDTLDASIGPPALIPNGRLAGRFGSIGGGGNTALGGNTIVIASKDYEFRPDGTFYQESFGGGGNSFVYAGASRSTLGRWRLDGATLSLTYPDGTRLRTSVYWSAKGDLVNGVPDAIWIGGKAYTLED